MVVDRLGELLDRVVEGLGVGALELEHGQQRLVTLGVLLLAVLGLVLGDRVLAAQLRVDELLLRLRVRHVQGRERVPDGGAVAGAVAQVTQQRLEAPVVPMIGTAIPLLGTVVQRKDIIESNKRRIVRKQERELRRQQRKQLPPSAPA